MSVACDQENVEAGYRMFRQFATDHGLSKPNDVLNGENGLFTGQYGLCAVWKQGGAEPLRFAILVRGDGARETFSGIRNRLKRWD